MKESNQTCNDSTNCGNFTNNTIKNNCHNYNTFNITCLSHMPLAMQPLPHIPSLPSIPSVDSVHSIPLYSNTTHAQNIHHGYHHSQPVDAINPTTAYPTVSPAHYPSEYLSAMPIVTGYPPQYPTTLQSNDPSETPPQPPKVQQDIVASSAGNYDGFIDIERRDHITYVVVHTAASGLPHDTQQDIHKKMKLCSYPGCAFTCAFASIMTRHTRKHNGKKPFECEQCHKRFTRKGSLKVHQDSVHRGLKPYSCPYCANNFVRKSGVKLHIKKIHKL
eukprot:118621_1